MIFLYIIYHDEGGEHAIIAAAIHLNLLPMDQKPSKSQVLDLLSFHNPEDIPLGRLLFHGKDIYDNAIYTLGRKHGSVLIVNALKSVMGMLDCNEEEIQCVNTSIKSNPYNCLGKICYRLGFSRLGKRLWVHGILKSYDSIANKVKKNK